MTKWIGEKIKSRSYLNSSRPAEVKKQLDYAANVIENFENPSIEEKNIRFRKIDASGFYSTVEDALDRIKQDKGTPA